MNNLKSYLFLFISLLITVSAVGADQGIKPSEGKWTRLLDGEWSVQRVFSKDNDLVYLSEAPGSVTNERVWFEDKYFYPRGFGFTEFRVIHAKVLNLSTLNIIEGEVYYRDSGHGDNRFQFNLIEPGGGIYILPALLLSPDGNKIIFNMSPRRGYSSIGLIAPISEDKDKYKYVDSIEIIPEAPKGKTERVFNAYIALLEDESNPPDRFDIGSAWPVWISSFVGWASDAEFLYLSNRTTDVKTAWLKKDKDWLDKVRFSLWKMNTSTFKEEIIWDSKALKEQILFANPIQDNSIFAYGKDNYYILDNKGKMKLKLDRKEWGFPSPAFARPEEYLSQNGNSIIMKKKETNELWIIKSGSDHKIKIPDFPAPLFFGVGYNLSPNGQRLAYISRIQDEPALVAMDVKENAVVRAYKLQDTREEIDERSWISWVGNDSLILAAVKRPASGNKTEGEEQGKSRATWLLNLKQ